LRSPDFVGFGRQVEQAGDFVAEFDEASLHRRVDGVEPVAVADGVFDAPSGENVFDAKGNEVLLFADGDVDLASHVVRLIGALGEDEKNYFALGDGVDDGLTPLRAERDVAGSDPAGNAVSFQRGTSGVGNVSIFGGVADEDVAGHTGRPDGGIDVLRGQANISEGAWERPWFRDFRRRYHAHNASAVDPDILEASKESGDSHSNQSQV